jgi:uncharacterized protein YyaL (SSP411 family)
LANAYLDGYLATGNQAYATVVRETLDYVLNYMTDDCGGFHSAEDADSEGEEGKFYVWTKAEIERVLGEEKSQRFCYVYDVTDAGNFEDRNENILNLPKTVEQCARLRGWAVESIEEELKESRRKLLSVRDARVRPGKDDKVLLGWNALTIDALARAGGVLDAPPYLRAARAAAEFVLQNMSRSDGRLLHCWRRGRAKLDAYLDDYTFFINCLVTLYEADFDETWIDHAVRLADLLLKHFADPDSPGFYYTADDHERLIARNKDLFESSIPSGNSMAATALIRLGKLCGRGDYLQAAEGVLQMATGLMQRAPSAAGQMLSAADMLLGPLQEIVVVGNPATPPTTAVIASLRKRYLPKRVIACREEGRPGVSSHLQPLFAGKSSQGAEPTVYLCRDFTCAAPVSGPEAIGKALQELASGH